MTEEPSEELEERRTVRCDWRCGAYEEPRTLEECKAALEHWINHPDMNGCSHGC